MRHEQIDLTFYCLVPIGPSRASPAPWYSDHLLTVLRPSWHQPDYVALVIAYVTSQDPELLSPNVYWGVFVLTPRSPRRFRSLDEMKYYAFRRQPFKALYTAGSILALIFVRLPFWAIAYLAPGLRPRRNWSIGRCLIVLICQSYSSMLFATEVPVTQPIEHAPLEENDQGFVWIEPVFGSLIVGEIKDMAEVNGVEAVRVGGYWIGPRGRTMRAGEHALQDEKVIYHIHG